MPIEFTHTDRPGRFIFTSPQLPGWICSGPTREIAQAQVKGSLRSYLRNERDIDPKIRQQLVKMVGG